MSIDFSKLHAEVKEAATTAVIELRSAHPSEHFYGFALYTDDGVAGICAAANSEEGLTSAILRYKFKDPRENIALRWDTGEWQYEGFGSSHKQGP